MFDNIDERLIFLIGLPRSGTTLLQSLLVQNSSIYSRSECWLLLNPVLSLRGEGIVAPTYGAANAARALREFLVNCGGGEATYLAGIAKMAGALYGAALETSGRQLFLDKSPLYYLIIREIKAIFPRAKFVVLLRNPLSILGSMAATWFGGRCDRILLDSRYRCSLFAGPAALIDGIDALGSACFVLRYEDLVADPEAPMRAVAAYLGVEFSETMLSYDPEGLVGATFGDRKIKRHAGPVTSSLALPSLFADGANHRFALRYLDHMGEQSFSRLGYDLSETKSRLVAMRQRARPVVATSGSLGTTLVAAGRSLFFGGRAGFSELRKTWRLSRRFPSADELLWRKAPLTAERTNRSRRR